MKRCPMRYMTPSVAKVARAYKYKNAGILPVSGGWLEQSATLIDAFDILDREMASYADNR